jgi:hypothetical protein
MERSTAIHFAKQAMAAFRYRGRNSGRETYQGRDYPWSIETMQDDEKGLFEVSISTWVIRCRFNGAVATAARII